MDNATVPAVECPIQRVLNVMGGKWKPLIYFYLLDGTKRFGELQRLIPEVTRQMLTQHLREMEADGIVHREVYSQVPPKVEYSLTELGREMHPVLHVLHEWASENFTASDPVVPIHLHSESQGACPSTGQMRESGGDLKSS